MAIASQRGARPLHRPRSNAKWACFARIDYEKGVRFGRQFPNRFQELIAQRSLMETTFAMTKGAFGDRLGSRTPTARANEIKRKKSRHNIRVMLI